jgi:hypothetical protein
MGSQQQRGFHSSQLMYSLLTCALWFALCVCSTFFQKVKSALGYTMVSLTFIILVVGILYGKLGTGLVRGL